MWTWVVVFKTTCTHDKMFVVYEVLLITIYENNLVDAGMTALAF